MIFDKSKVYTALNADELKIGSKCIFANTVQLLRKIVQSDNAHLWAHKLIEIRQDDDAERFVNKATSTNLAYLIEPPPKCSVASW